MNFTTKFNPGQSVFLLNDRTPKKSTIHKVFVSITVSAGCFQAEETIFETPDGIKYYTDNKATNMVFATEEELFTELKNRIK